MAGTFKLKDTAVVFSSQKYGKVCFTTNEVEQYGADHIDKHIHYLDTKYQKHVNDPHALILNAMSAQWWIQEPVVRSVPSYEDTKEYCLRQEADRKAFKAPPQNEVHKKFQSIHQALGVNEQEYERKKRVEGILYQNRVKTKIIKPPKKDSGSSTAEEAVKNIFESLNIPLPPGIEGKKGLITPQNRK